MPRLVILYMAVVAVVSPVADPPAMVRYQNRGVGNVANQVIDLFAAAEALVATAHLKTWPLHQLWHKTAA